MSKLEKFGTDGPVKDHQQRSSINREPSMIQNETHYMIELKGHLDKHWSVWLDGLHIMYSESGNTTLCGVIPDQAALHGILVKIRDLGLPLLSLRRGESENEISNSWENPD
jgi:hypothetical protein